MFITIIRYGGLLAAFLIVLAMAKRSYISNFSEVDGYIGISAGLFLLLGTAIGVRLVKRKPQVRENSELSAMATDGFSERELEVLLFLCHGYSNSEIAEHLKITTNTVKSHLKNIYGKLGVTNRTQAAAEAKMLNIIV